MVPDRTVDSLPSSSIHPEEVSRPESGFPKAKGRRRSSHNKTSYQLAHPPPSTKSRQRLRIRPRTLLQLRQISNASRPQPVLDVLPSILFAPRLTRRIPQIIQGKQGLGLDDLVFVRSQAQDLAVAAHDGLPEEADDIPSNSREVIAAICQSSPTNDHGQYRTEIRFSQDSVWIAAALKSGAYEFVSQINGETQSIARWVPKRDANTESSTDAQKFKFSLIDTNCRRHPVIANMSKQSIDVYDWYTVPSNAPDAHQTADIDSVDSTILEDSPGAQTDGFEEPSKTIVETDDYLRIVIAVTGIWVAFCEGWSPNFKYSTKQVISNGVSELANRRRNNTSQSTSQTVERPHPHHQLQSIKETRRRPGILHTSSLSSVPFASSPGSPLTSPRRTISSSAAGIDSQSRQIVTQLASDYQPRSNSNVAGGDGWSHPKASIAAAHAGLEKTPDIHDKVMESRRTYGDQKENKMMVTESFTREENGHDLVSEATLVEEVCVKPGKLKRVLGYLSRAKTTRGSRRSKLTT
ncbi:MAG: hypothetical protein Q9219_006754 [cf. Caloplaca sp. 3 TL-2023]